MNRAEAATFVQSINMPVLFKTAILMAIPQLPAETFDSAIPFAADLLTALVEGRGEDAIRLFNSRVSESDRGRLIDLLKHFDGRNSIV